MARKQREGETWAAFLERERAYSREYRRRRRAAGLETMGNEHRKRAPVQMVMAGWVLDAHGVLSREVRGV